jgi:transcriptional regulator with XRE-family HTH domain
VLVSTQESVGAAVPVGAALRRLRDKAGLTTRDASAALGWSSSKLSRIETSLTRVKRADLGRLLDLYGAAPEARAEIEELLDQALRPARGGSNALPDVYERYAELEARASKISMYAAAVVPGLLQIPEYAAAVIRATPEPEDHLAQERLNARLQRQTVFARPVTLDVVIDEAVLRRVIGDDDVMRRQMSRLQEFGSRPDTTIRVLPFEVGAHPALTGQFVILDFSDGGRTPPRVFCDGLTGGSLRGRADDVHRYRACFAALHKLALSVKRSAEFFASVPR